MRPAHLLPSAPVALTVDQALTFAGYTAAEIEASGLTYREIVALAVAEARELGALVVVTAREVAASCQRAGAAFCRAVGAVFRARASRRKARVDRKGYRHGLAKPRTWGVTPRPVVEARRAGAAHVMPRTSSW